jgi:hypothetical protein
MIIAILKFMLIWLDVALLQEATCVQAWRPLQQRSLGARTTAIPAAISIPASERWSVSSATISSLELNIAGKETMDHGARSLLGLAHRHSKYLSLSQQSVFRLG